MHLWRHTAFVLMISSILVGCGKRISQGGYERISTDMTLSEVESILGPGTEQSSSDASFGGISMSGKNMVWQDGERIISITFVNEKVKAKAQLGL
jgi:hypothetical protein